MDRHSLHEHAQGTAPEVHIFLEKLCLLDVFQEFISFCWFLQITKNMHFSPERESKSFYKLYMNVSRILMKCFPNLPT